MTPRILNLDGAKGYATEANLRAALARLGLDEWDMASYILIARKPDGKWTAVFVLDKSKGGYIAQASQHGFMTV